MEFPSYCISGQSGWTNMDNTPVLPYSGHFKSLDHAGQVCSQAQHSQPCANPIVGQLTCSSAVKTSPPSGASDLLHQTMDLSMITSPTTSPYGYYGMFSPVTPNISPTYSPGYMRNLRRNPMFQDLQMLLAQECYGVQVPANLITTSWNLMQLPFMDPSASVISGSQDVYFRHMQLQDKLLKVRIDPHVSADGLKVENEYSTKVGQIEMGRYHALVSNMGNALLKTAVNSYYDKERVTLAWKMEVDLDRLIAKAEEIRKSVTIAKVMQKESSQGRPPKRNVVQTQRVVRQLTFGGLDDNGEKDSFDSGFKSDVEDFDADIETFADSANDKQTNLNKNFATINRGSQLYSLKQKTIADNFYKDEKCFIQPNNIVNLSPVNLFPVKPLSDKSCSVNNDKLMTPNHCGYSQSSINCCNLSLSVRRKESKNIVICTPELRNSPSVELSPLNDQSDFLLRIACGSSGKSKAVQSSTPSQVESPIVSFHPELQASSSSQQNYNPDKSMDTTLDHSKENKNLHSLSHFPCLKTHKVLSSDAANILSTWYERHLQYPYPTEEEVKELTELTGVTEKQVKKWMANKRIRCFNTLSITGNKHPIKFKYEGRGKKRKHSEVEKDDSSRFESNSNGLTEESRKILNNWFDSHLDNPYPLEEEKKELALQCGITLAQVKSWFANKRSRTNKTRKQVPNYFIKKFPQYAPMVQVIGEQRVQARVAKKCRFSNFTYMVPFM